MEADTPQATDKLTQLQDCFDQLAAQMFLSLHHIKASKPVRSIDGQPDYINAPANAVQNNSADPNAETSPPPSATSTRLPHSVLVAQQQATLTADLHELSSDMVKRYQQIDHIIKTLPGLGESQTAQEQRIQELNEQLKALDVELERAAEERDALVERVDDVIAQVRRP